MGGRRGAWAQTCDLSVVRYDLRVIKEVGYNLEDYVVCYSGFVMLFETEIYIEG